MNITGNTTIDDIRATCKDKTPAQFYNGLTVLNMTPNSATLGELRGLTFENESFAYLLAEACIESICSAYQRSNPMDNSEIRKTAETMVIVYPMLTVYELKDFELKLTASRIPYRYKGVDEYDLKAVDRNNILGRLKVYLDLFKTNRTVVPDAGPHIDLVKGEPKCLYDDWKMRHNFLGEEMPEGWDFYKHWSSAPDMSDPRERAKVNAICEKIQKACKKMASPYRERREAV